MSAYAQFACDWVPQGATHEEGVDACVDRLIGHGYTPEDARAEVKTWGYLGNEESV